MPTYLITGVAGFIGSSIARVLLKRGEKVRGIDNLATGNGENIEELLPHLDFQQSDIRDLAAVKKACSGVDYVLHQAALASVPRSVKEPLLTNEVNVGGTLNVLVAAKGAGVKRVVYAASSSAYGDTPTLPKHEGMLPNPISPYAVSKLAGEHYMSAFYRVYGLETVSLRYFNIFGPRQDANSEYSAVLAKFITSMLNGQTPVIFGDGEQSRDFTYVDNAVQANLLACTAPAQPVAGQVFNVATGQRYTLNQTVELVRELTNFNGQPEFTAERAGDVKHSLADISRAQQHLGYSASVDFKEGLKLTVAWYRTAQKSVANVS
jgi:UDP-glucose 4-epimerase